MANGRTSPGRSNGEQCIYNPRYCDDPGGTHSPESPGEEG